MKFRIVKDPAKEVTQEADLDPLDPNLVMGGQLIVGQIYHN